MSASAGSGAARLGVPGAVFAVPAAVRGAAGLGTAIFAWRRPIRVGVPARPATDCRPHRIAAAAHENPASV
ncbi:hypothetical protein BSLA_02f2025 [Burkholderia stabilis]|nr:hypothetical protein BSLA_02f2025 [Burkholderia stabilis]